MNDDEKLDKEWSIVVSAFGKLVIDGDNQADTIQVNKRGD